jgi:two-component system response regulator WspF
MGCGALDAVATPVLGPDGKIQGGEALLAKIANLARLTGRREASEPPVRPAARLAFEAPGTAPLVAIGASTGGPKALADVLARRRPILARASSSSARGCPVRRRPGRLAGQPVPLAVRLAVEGGEVVCNQILLAASNDHLALGPIGGCTTRQTRKSALIAVVTPFFAAP